MNETNVEVVEEAPVSRKREVTAVVTATVVSIVLAGAASVLIDKISTRVKKTIAPEPDSE
jgi:hypothetical protein